MRLILIAGEPPRARAHSFTKGTNGGSSNRAQLYRWEKAPDDTATWLYNLIFSDTVPAWPSIAGHPDQKIDKMVQSISDRKVATLSNINAPKIVDQLLLQWTSAPAIAVAQDRPLAGLTNEDREWKGAIVQNVNNLLTKEADELYFSGYDSGGFRPRSRSRQRVPRRTSPFSNSRERHSERPLPAPRDPRVDSYSYIPPPMPLYGAPLQPDPNIKAIKELLLEQERRHLETKHNAKDAKIEALEEIINEAIRAKERVEMEARATADIAKIRVEADHAIKLREERELANREMEERTEKIKHELEAKGAAMVARCEAKHKEEMEKQAVKLEADKYAIEDLIDVVHVVGHPSSIWDHTETLGKLDLRAHFNPANKKLAQQHAIHGTLLWTPPATPAICEMYEKLKMKGWKPLWKRSNSKCGDSSSMGSANCVRLWRDLVPWSRRLFDQFLQDGIQTSNRSATLSLIPAIIV